MCPWCDGWMSSNITKICRAGIKTFLVSAFNDEYTGKITPMQLAKKLKEFPNAGQLIYKRKSAKKVQSLMIAQLTILQLLAAKIIRLEIDTDGKKPLK